MGVKKFPYEESFSLHISIKGDKSFSSDLRGGSKASDVPREGV